MAPVLRIAARALGWLVLLAVALTVVAVVVVPRAGGAQALTVLTGSMTPSLPVGSVVVSRAVDPWTIGPGDVISFQVAPGDPTLVTHRVVEVVTADGELEFRTKGDANDGDDLDLVPAGAVVGELWYHVPWVGHLTVRAGDPAVLLAVAVLGLLAYAGHQLFAAVRSTRGGLRRHLVLASASGPAARTVLDVARANGGHLVSPATDPRQLPAQVTVECVVDPDAVAVLERALREAGATSVATAAVQLPGPGRRPAPSPADHQVGTTA